jgi:hypothetical protein
LEGKFLVVGAVDPIRLIPVKYSGKGNVGAPEVRLMMATLSTLKPGNLAE